MKLVNPTHVGNLKQKVLPFKLIHFTKIKNNGYLTEIRGALQEKVKFLNDIITI